MWGKGYAQAPNPITGAYYVNCTDFSLWRLNQQVGATDPQKPKYTNSNFIDGMVLGNGGDWAGTWRAKGWPVDHTPDVRMFQTKDYLKIVRIHQGAIAENISTETFHITIP